MRLHPDIGSLQRFAGHEGARRTGEHVARCAACRDTVAWIREARTVLRTHAPVEAPPAAWESITQRLAAGETVVLPKDAVPEPLAGTTRSVLRAAAIALAVITGGVAAGVPGSPLREWLREVLLDTPNHPLTAEDTAVGASASPAPTTLLVAPDDGNVVLEVVSPDAAVRLRVRVTDRFELIVQAEGATAAAQFSSGPGRLSVHRPGAGDIRIDIPRHARRTAILVDGRTYLVHEAGELTIFLPSVDTVGGEIVLPIQR